MRSALSPTRRRLRAVRQQFRRHRRMIAAALVAAATVAGVRAVAPPPPDTVAVSVAARDLPSGTVLGASDVVRREVPSDLVPTLAIDSPAGRVVAAPIAEGEIVTEVRTLGAELAQAEAGQRLLPVRLPDAGVAALLRQGDVVDLLATDPATGTARVVAREIRVLATPKNVPDGPSGGSSGALIVVGVSDAEAVTITAAALSEFLSVTFGR